MSNLSVLERLEKALVTYEQDAMSRIEFVKFLNRSIEALEGVPYSVQMEFRKHEYDIEIEDYFEAEGFESNSIAAKNALKVWIQQLKELYGVSNS
jgi:hypothetical protein